MLNGERKTPIGLIKLGSKEMDIILIIVSVIFTFWFIDLLVEFNTNQENLRAIDIIKRQWHSVKWFFGFK